MEEVPIHDDPRTHQGEEQETSVSLNTRAQHALLRTIDLRSRCTWTQLAKMCLFERDIDIPIHSILLQSLLAADAHHLSANQNQEQKQGLHRQHDTTRCNSAYQHPHAS